MAGEQGGLVGDAPKPGAEAPKNDPRTAIIVAIIGVIGVLGTGLFSNWDKLIGASKADDHPKAATGQVNASPTVSPTINPTISPTFNQTFNPTINVTAGPSASQKSLSLVTCFALPGIPPGLRDQYAEQAMKDSEKLAVALATSALDGNLACVRGLLDAGAPPNGPGLALGGESSEMTPLFGAIQAHSVDMMKLLLDAGADPNLRAMADAKSRGISPIAAAALFSSVEGVKLLLAKGADVNGRTKDGQSALHRAVMHGDAQIVRELVAQGAKVDAKEEDNGKTPLDYAKEGHADLIPLLAEGKK
jgi:Ankyrin repeats (3 copies)